MQRDHHYFVYLLASKPFGTLYCGVTNDLGRRMSEHRAGTGSKFTSKYDVVRLVWYEQHSDIELAIAREKAIKKWRRAWKIRMIETDNPHWEDLAKTFQ